MQWDPAQYARFADQRLRPFHDLVARIGAEAPSTVMDVGCGPGNATETLTRRWPQASVTGVDSSEEMIRRAQAMEGDRLRFRLADAHEVEVGDVDVLVSNAMLQWLPDHRRLVEAWSAAMAPGAWLAFQVPGNFSAPSHQALHDVAADGPWAARLSGALLDTEAVDPAVVYAERLVAAGWSVDAWESTYVQWLTGEDPVLQWVRGSALRPVAERLDPHELQQFEARYAALVRDAYPARRAPDGTATTALPFRRIFVVAQRH